MQRPKVNESGIFGLLLTEIMGTAVIVSDAGVTIQESKTGAFHFIEWHELNYFISATGYV